MGKEIGSCLRCGLPLSVRDDWLWAGDGSENRAHRRCPASREREERTWYAADALRACTKFAMKLPPSGEPWAALAGIVERLAAVAFDVACLDAVIADVCGALAAERASHPNSIDGDRLRRARDQLALLRVVIAPA